MLLILRQNENLCSEAKGDVHSVPFCTGLLLFCETSPRPPHWMHPSLSWSLHYPWWEEELPFSSVSESLLAGSDLWTVGRTAATSSSVPSETLFVRASQNSAVLLLTIPLLQGGLINFNCIILWITSGSTSAFLLSHICPDLLAWFCFSFPPW